MKLATSHPSNRFIFRPWQNGSETRAATEAVDGSGELLRFPVFGVEVELNFSARSLLRRINDASIKGPRIYVKANRALVKFPGIHYAMHGIGGIYGARIGNIHLDRVSRLQAAGSPLQILMNKMEVFHLHASDGNRHPAILVAMIVHRTRLPNLPANGHQFVR